jgi:hypothetical protein
VSIDDCVTCVFFQGGLLFFANRKKLQVLSNMVSMAHGDLEEEEELVLLGQQIGA